MAPTSIVYVLRHTTPAIAPGTCYGTTDVALAPTFEDEARAVLAALPEVDRIVSSPLDRCLRLARYLAARRQLPLQIDARLREFDFGRWEGLRWEGLRWEAVPREELDAWAADFLHARPHGGDSMYAFRLRAQAAYADLQDRSGATLAVTHGGVIKTLLAAGEGAEDHAVTLPYGGLCALLPAQGK